MDKDCTIYKTTNFIGKRWTLLILLELYRGKQKQKRYSQLKNNLPGITPKILSVRLKELEKEELIIKKIDTNIFPIKCEYSLTKSGEDFIKIIKDIKKWALRWKTKNTICRNADCRECIL
ncbi:transcriptional regulator [Candidatus Woesearchaeota archaeon]|nr:transcriptional regulator [Candidatus Woesearchaeota archaeon]|tara:strand:- start:915 stop:1274 length:360 start_codon:yes stop_codon:yes gene_type:complete